MNFIEKNWPKREFNAVFNKEASTGEVRVLPLLVGDQKEKETIINQFFLMNDKLYLSWEGSCDPIVKALQKRLDRPSIRIENEFSKPIENIIENKFPMPKIKKIFNQREKDLYINKVFEILKSCFQQALQKMEASYPETETEFTEIHNFKFISKIYVNGELKTQWKIWISNMFGRQEIAYSVGNFSLDNDNSRNGMLSIEDDGYELYVTLPFGGMNTQGLESGKYTPEEAVKFLWIDLTKCLEH